MAHAHAAQQSAFTGEHDFYCFHLQQASPVVLRVSWLTPDIVAAIAEGREPATLTGRRLLRAADVPLSWEEQRRYFGFS